MTAEIPALHDKQLGRSLAHHRFMLKCPVDWFPDHLATRVDGVIMARHCFGSKGTHYLDCEVVEPAEHKGKTIQFPISEPVLSKKQIAKGERENNAWWIRKLLDTVFAEPATLEDIGMSKSTRRCSTCGDDEDTRQGLCRVGGAFFVGGAGRTVSRSKRDMEGFRISDDGKLRSWPTWTCWNQIVSQPSGNAGERRESNDRHPHRGPAIPPEQP